jgi:hypothetical protein
MAERNPIDDAINKIAEMLQFVYDQKDGKMSDLPEGIWENLENVRKKIDKFKELNEAMYREAGLKQEDLSRQIRATSTNLPPKDRKIFDKATMLKNELTIIYEQIKAVKERGTPSSSPLAGDKKHPQVPKRGGPKKQHLKGIRKGWTKL